MSTPIIPVPTLSTLGWVSDSVTKFDRLLSHFFLADYNQTYLYRGFVTSLTRIIQKNGSNTVGLLRELESSLQSYLMAYYVRVEVTARLASSEAENPSSKVEVVLTIGIGEGSTQSVYSRLLQSSDSKLDKIIELNNG